MPTRDLMRWWLPAFAGAAVLFAAFPAIDIAVSSAFWGGAFGDWPLRRRLPLATIRTAVSFVVWVPVVVVAVGALARSAGLRLPAAFSLRAVCCLALTYLLGPALVANWLLKDNWGRARPYDIEAFGGTAEFTAAWMPSAAGGASFVSGEVAIAAAACAAALLATGRARRWLLALGLVLTALIGAVRLAQGAHFLSDVVFAALLVWLVAWLCHSALFRWTARDVAPHARAS